MKQKVKEENVLSKYQVIRKQRKYIENLQRTNLKNGIIGYSEPLV